jgi:hypothetical protein
MGKKGQVTNLLTEWDVVLAEAIQGAMSRGSPLDSLSSKRDYQEMINAIIFCVEGISLSCW